MNRFVLSLIGLLPVVQGCSSSYEPAKSPRIALVMDSGTPQFAKDGQHSGNLAFGTGLVDAVRGNPRAEAEARTGRNLAIGGFILDLTGVVCATSGLVLLGGRDRPNQHREAAAGLAIGGLVAVTVGTVLLLNSQPHIYDAVNIYNDGLQPAR